VTGWRWPLALLGLIAVGHLLYQPLGEWLAPSSAPDAVASTQRKLFYVLRGVEGMGLCIGLMPLKYAQKRFPGLLWASACWWGFAEEGQTAICRIATWSEPVKNLPNYMLCSDVLGNQAYLFLFAALLAALSTWGLTWTKPK